MNIRLLSIIFAMVVLFCIAVPVLAETISMEGQTEENFSIGDGQEKEKNNSVLSSSGTCGENLTWVLTHDGTLIISGTGTMESYSNDNEDDSHSSPWNSSSVKTIILENGITNIGSYAFWACENLTSIEIPESVIDIGDGAFRYCSSLTSIKMPESITNIGNGTFCYCSSLTSIEIPKSVTNIGEGAFWYCDSLISIEIPESVTKIGAVSFYSCSSLKSIEIPKSVTSIGEGAFYSCGSLTSIEIPNKVITIEGHTFDACNNLRSVKLPESITSIGEGAFYSCSSLTSIEIPENVTIISPGAFLGCANLKNVIIPNGVTSIGEFAFYKCSNLKRISIPSSVTEIGSHALIGYPKEYGENSDIVVEVEKGSYAEQYCKENDLNYEVISSVITVYADEDKDTSGTNVNTIPVKTVVASSELIENGLIYKEENIADGKSSTCWSEGAREYGIGETIELVLDKPHDISKISVTGGWAISQELFEHNAKPAVLKVFFSSSPARSYELAMEDKMNAQTFKLEEENVEWIRFEIADIFKGKKGVYDTCISEITLLGS